MNGSEPMKVYQDMEDEMPTATGITTADEMGEILFQFTKLSEQVHLSGIAMWTEDGKKYFCLFSLHFFFFWYYK